MNNKGQTLVLFIALLPLIFIIFAFVFDFSKLSMEKTKLDGIAKNSLRYSMINNKSEAEVKENILINDKTISINYISYNDICLEKEVKPIFGGIIGYDIFKIKSCFQGEINNNKLIVTEKGN